MKQKIGKPIHQKSPMLNRLEWAEIKTKEGEQR